MTEWAEAWRRVDVVILTALPLEYDAVLEVDAGAVAGSTWERARSPDNLPLAFRSFEVPVGRPLRVAVAVAADMGATAAIHALMPLVESLKPRCIAMCGVCAGRPGKTQLGDVVAADRVYYHDTGKQQRSRVQQDLKTYNLRDDWKLALEGMDVVGRFRKKAWFKTRPLTTEARLHRALIALRDGVAEPWNAIDPAPGGAEEWPLIVDALRERRLLAASSNALTQAGRRFVEDFLFRHRQAVPDLSTTGKTQPFRLHVAPIGSGTRVIEDDRVWGFVSQAMRKTLGIEMEAAVVGEFAHRQRRHKLDWVVMKGVMDFANHGRDDHFKPFAARASAECLLAFLRDNLPTEAIPDFDDLLTSGVAPLPDHAPPSVLLIARHVVVPWHDRERAKTIAELDAWAEEPARDVAVRLVHAAGGVGKTRLAIEWLRRRAESGDVAGFLGREPGEHWLHRLCERGEPVVVVVDYAESRTDLVALLERLTRYAEASGPRRRVRMLLLARSDGDWWTELQRRGDAIGALLRLTAPIALAPLAPAAPDRDEVFSEAATVFAEVLGKPVVRRPPIELSDLRFNRVLYLHMAALAAVEGVAFDAGTLMDVILDHEERFWKTEAAARQHTQVDVLLARQLVAAATLRGGIAREEDVQDLCARLARRPRSHDDDALLATLRAVYRRAGEPRYLPGLEPDLLGEAMVTRVAVLRGDADVPGRDVWIDRVFGAADDEQALTTGFTVMGRASVTDGAVVRTWIAGLLATELATRAVLALRAAKVVGQRTAFSVLGDVLAQAVEQHGSVTLANALDQEGIPYPTASLRRVAAWRSTLILDTTNASGDDETMALRARRLDRRGRDLAAAGRREEALEASRDSTALYRQLAERHPEAFQPGLARSLSNLGFRLSDLGQREEALETTREAVALFRRLAAQDPDAFQGEFALSLNNLSIDLSNVGQRAAALEAMRESVALRRELAARHPDAFQGELALSLNNLGLALSELAQAEEALGASRESVALFRELAAQNPDAFQPNLAVSLNNLGFRLSDMEQYEEALEATRESVALRRELAARYPDVFRGDFAMSLNNLSVDLSNVGQSEAALEASREAVALFRELAVPNPDVFQPELARSLNNLGVQLSDMGRYETALEAVRESVALRRELAMRHPDAFQPDLASSLSNLGTRLSELGKRQEALEATHESVSLYRKFATRHAEMFQADLARTLNDLGIRFSELGRREAALDATRESVELHRRLAMRHPDAFQPDLATSLNNLSKLLGELGQHEAAQEAIREAGAVGLKARSASHSGEADAAAEPAQLI